MRKRTISLLGLVTLLMGADGAQRTAADLPRCAANTYLVYRGGQIVCESMLPSCSDQLLHADPGGTLEALICTPQAVDVLGDADRQRLRDLQQQSQRILGKLAAMGITPPLMATFAGNTAKKTSGRIEYPGVAAGLPAANATCAHEFGFGAHMCSLREMFGAVLSRTLDPTLDVVPAAWLYMPTWSSPAATTPALSGLGDSCAGYTDGTSANQRAGTAVSWEMSVPNLRTLQFYNGSEAPCEQARPIACCR